MNRSYFAKIKLRHLYLLLLAVFFTGCGFFGEVARTGFTQSSDNMTPTIRANDFFGCATNFLNNYDFKGNIGRGSVVVVTMPNEQIPKTDDIKPVIRRGSEGGKHALPPVVPGHSEFVYRVAGVGEDKVKITNGRVYVNDALFEKIPENPDKSSIEDLPEVVVPPGEYFLLGDNLGNRFDSRFWKNKTLSKDKIICKVSYVFDDQQRSRPFE